MREPFFKRRQKGSLLAELGVVMVIAAVATSYYLSQQAKLSQEELWDGAALQVGEAAAAVGDATKTLSTGFFTQIQRNLPITSPSGYVIPANRVRSPSLDDLVAVANLPPRFAQPIVYANQSISFDVQLTVDTSNGCVVPTCNLISVVRTTAPIVDPKDNSVVDLRRATMAAKKASPGNAGVSLPESPGIFSGRGGINVAANSGNAAGLIGLRGGYDSSGMMEFDRRDGSLPRTGDMNMQDTTGTKHNIANAGRVTTDDLRAGQLTANTLGVDQLTAGTTNTTTLNATNSSHNSLYANSLSTPSAWATYLGATTVNSDSVSANYIRSNGRVTASEYLEVVGWATEGAWCEKEGLIGRGNGGLIFSCQSGVWRQAQGSGGRGIQGFLSPYKNMTISCNPWGRNESARARVDGSGNLFMGPYSRWPSPGYQECMNQTQCGGVTFTGVGIIYSVYVPDGGDSTGGNTYSCSANFPSS